MDCGFGEEEIDWCSDGLAVACLDASVHVTCTKHATQNESFNFFKSDGIYQANKECKLSEANNML